MTNPQLRSKTRAPFSFISTVPDTSNAVVVEVRVALRGDDIYGDLGKSLRQARAGMIASA